MTQPGRYVYRWPRPMVTVDAVVFAPATPSPKVLLIKRRSEPFKDKWALPGGFVDIDEELEDAVARELKEETGLTGIVLTQLYTFGKVGRDPRGRTISIAFIGVTSPDNMATNPGDDAAEAAWFQIDALPELAYDHSLVLAKAGEKYHGE